MDGGRPRCRVVLVDDASDYRFLIREVLTQQADFEVVGEASDSQTAVDEARRTQPDVVLLDVALPDADGFEVIPAIREVAPDARVVMLSAFAAGRLAARAVELGAAGYLEKAVRPSALVTGLRSLLGEVSGVTDPPA